MIDFLGKLGIDEKTIFILNNKYHDSVLYSISCNEYEITEIISYLQKIGIKCVDKLLIDNIDLFLNSVDNVVNMFNKYSTKELVENINNYYN